MCMPSTLCCYRPVYVLILCVFCCLFLFVIIVCVFCGLFIYGTLKTTTSGDSCLGPLLDSLSEPFQIFRNCSALQGRMRSPSRNPSRKLREASGCHSNGNRKAMLFMVCFEKKRCECVCESGGVSPDVKVMDLPHLGRGSVRRVKPLEWNGLLLRPSGETEGPRFRMW